MSKIILDSPDNRNNIGTKIKQLWVGGKDCKIVSAYVSDDDIFHCVNKIDSLEMICNARTSSTNPYTLQSLLKNKNIEIRSRNDIHAKAYIFDKNAIITSANATPNGLGVGTIEAASLVNSKNAIADINSWFYSLWNHSGTEDLRGLTKNEWKVLEASWNLKNLNNKTINLIDLINSESIPDDIIFCFWHETEENPDKDRVASASRKQGVVELPENIEDWDFLIEGGVDEVNKNKIDKLLKKHYSKICINIKTDTWPASKIYKRETFPSRFLDRTIEYAYRKNQIILSLYRTDNIKLPFVVDKESIALINSSLSFNRAAWKSYRKTEGGKCAYCTPRQLYKLVKQEDIR